MSATARGMLISLEGVEGAGKSTLADGLQERLAEAGAVVRRTREPGGTSLGEAVRAVVLDATHGEVSPWAELFLMLAARAQLVRELVEPALARGEVVLCDRYADASTAYQGAGRELGLEAVQELNRRATGGRFPDLTFLLDLDPREGRARQSHDPDRMEREDLDFHLRVREGYLELARRESERFVVLDARRDPAALLEAAWTVLLERRPELRQPRRP